MGGLRLGLAAVTRFDQLAAPFGFRKASLCRPQSFVVVVLPHALFDVVIEDEVQFFVAEAVDLLSEKPDFVADASGFGEMLPQLADTQALQHGDLVGDVHFYDVVGPVGESVPRLERERLGVLRRRFDRESQAPRAEIGYSIFRPGTCFSSDGRTLRTDGQSRVLLWDITKMPD